MTKSVDIETIRALRCLGELVRHVLKPRPTGGAAAHLAWHAYTCSQQHPTDRCHYCNGYGSKVWDPIEGYPEKCLSCDGTGRLDRLAPAEPVTIPGRIA